MVLFYNNSLIDILLALTVFFVVIGFGFVLRTLLVGRIRRLVKQSESKIDDVVLVVLRSFGYRFYIVLATLVAFRFFITTSPGIESFVDKLFIVFIGFEIIMVLFRVIDFFAKDYGSRIEHSSLATTIPALSVLGKSLAALIIGTFLLSNLGVNVTTLLAGLGVGGIAIAFAFQKILTDLFSTFVIFFDKPFKVGDMIEVGDISGTVEQVGIKTTNVRAFTGERIVVPNQDFVSSQLRNTTDRAHRRASFEIPIAYDTPRKVLKTIPDTIASIVSSHESAVFSHASLREFGKYALIYDVVYRLKSASFSEYVSVRHAIHLEILEALQKEKITLGYPISFQQEG